MQLLQTHQLFTHEVQILVSKKGLEDVRPRHNPAHHKEEVYAML